MRNNVIKRYESRNVINFELQGTPAYLPVMHQYEHKLCAFSLTIKQIRHDNYRTRLQMSVRLTTLYTAVCVELYDVPPAESICGVPVVSRRTDYFSNH